MSTRPTSRPTSGPSDRSRSWRGETDVIIDPPRHRWQTGTGKQPADQLRSSSSTGGLRLLAMLLLTAGMLIAWLVVLLHVPVKTPVITVAATNYAWPLPPNAWASEDVRGLGGLNGLTIHWHDSSAAWQSKSTALEDLRDRLKQLSGLAKRCGALVLYLSMHGMVDQDGRPCLVPPGGNALSSPQWITLDDIQSTIGTALPDRVNVLLVLDCVDQRVNWSAGIVHTTFAESVEAWAANQRRRNLSIITSTSAEEQAWSGPDLHGSIFGQAFRLGLAGMADLPRSREVVSQALESSAPATGGTRADSTSPDGTGADDALGGNGDGEVTLLELMRYVQREVHQWSVAERSSAQTPRLFTANAAISSAADADNPFAADTAELFSVAIDQRPRDVRLTWALKRRELNRQVADAHPNQLAPVSPSTEELGELWSRLDQLRRAHVFTEDPKSWSELERRLLWLDKLSVSGSAYTDQATKEIYPELRDRLDELATKAQALAGNVNMIARSQLFASQGDAGMDDAVLPSLAWQEYLGKVDSTTAQALRGRLLSLVEGTNDESLESITASSIPLAGRQALNELNFVQLLAKYQRFDLWPDRTRLREALELRDRCEKLAVFGDQRAHRWRRFEISRLDALRRNVEDQLFLGSNDQTGLQWSNLRQAVADAERNAFSASELSVAAIELRAADQPVKNSPATGNFRQAALSLHDQGLAEATYLAAWICSPNNGMENLGEWLDSQSALDKNPLRTGLGPVPSSTNDPMRRERLAIDRLLQWIDDLHAIAQQLAEVPQDGQADLKRLDEICRDVLEHREQLSALVDEHVRRVLAHSLEDRTGLGMLDALLELPFLRAETRVELCKKREQWMLESLKRHAPPAATTLASRLTSLGGKLDAASATNIPLANRLAPPSAVDSASAATDQSSTQSTARDAPADSGRDPRSKSRYLDRMRGWSMHPLTAILQLATDPSQLVGNSEAVGSQSTAEMERAVIERVNAKLRAHYLSMAAFDGRQLGEWLVRADSRLQLPEDASEWYHAVIAAHVERAHLAVSPISPERSNTTSFRTMALKDQLYWYAERTLLDFYALAASESGPSTKTTFFESAADSLLQFAHTLPELTSDQELRTEQLRSQLAVLGPLARHGLKASVKSGVPLSGSALQPFEVSLRWTLATSSVAPPWQTAFPPGLGLALIRNSRGVIAGAESSMPLPPDADNSSCTINAPPLDRALPHEALVVYRGHEYKAPLFVGQGIVVDFQPLRYDWAEVVLFGDRQRQPSIMFVLDCSWSMGRQIPIEAIESRTQSRLELAKAHLIQLIAQIAARPDARLGVRLFGHRLGWSRNVDPTTGAALGGTQILPQPKYGGTIPDGLVPSRDVEAIVPLGRFEPTMVSGLQKTMEEIVPWGQSPLYLSIIESFRDFASDDTDTAKSIVVITDGDNFQFNSSRAPAAQPGAIVSKADVLRAWQSSQVPVYVLGVGVSEDESPDATRSLQELAETTGGRYYDIATGNDLLRALSEQLSTAEYSVHRQPSNANALSIGSADPELVAKLNSPVTLKGLGFEPVDYSIDFQTISKPFQVEGGESLEMFVQADNQDIVSRPFDREAPRSALLVRPGQNRRLLARVHRPSYHADGVLFPISFQDPDSHWTQRPKETWVEVVPVVDQSASRAAGSGGAPSKPMTYWFYDTQYQPRKPVPYQQWLASDWPTVASEADVRIWARYDSTPALSTIPLKLLAGDKTEYAEGRPLEGAQGVTLRIAVLEGREDAASWQLQVTELHDESSRGVGSLSIHLETDVPMLPLRITRRFDPESQLAVHTFSFEAATGNALLHSANARIIVRSRDTVQAGALQMSGEQPIRVELSRAQELLPLEATLRGD